MIQGLRGFVRFVPRGHAVNFERFSQASLRLGMFAMLARKHPEFGETLGRVLMMGTEGFLPRPVRSLPRALQRVDLPNGLLYLVISLLPQLHIHQRRQRARQQHGIFCRRLDRRAGGLLGLLQVSLMALRLHKLDCQVQSPLSRVL